MARVSNCDNSGATLYSCQVTRANLKRSGSFIITSQVTCCGKPNTLRQTQDHSSASNAWCPTPVMSNRDVVPSVSLSTEFFLPFPAVCLTIFLWEFWPRTFNIGLYKKRPGRWEILILILASNLGSHARVYDFVPTCILGQQPPAPSHQQFVNRKFSPLAHAATTLYSEKYIISHRCGELVLTLTSFCKHFLDTWRTTVGKESSVFTLDIGRCNSGGHAVACAGARYWAGLAIIKNC